MEYILPKQNIFTLEGIEYPLKPKYFTYQIPEDLKVFLIFSILILYSISASKIISSPRISPNSWRILNNFALQQLSILTHFNSRRQQALPMQLSPVSGTNSVQTHSSSRYQQHLAPNNHYILLCHQIYKNKPSGKKGLSKDFNSCP